MTPKVVLHFSIAIWLLLSESALGHSLSPGGVLQGNKLFLAGKSLLTNQDLTPNP